MTKSAGIFTDETVIVIFSLNRWRGTEIPVGGVIFESIVAAGNC